MSIYSRGGRAGSDFAEARAWELEVGEWLGDHKVGNLDDPNRLDWWVPGVYVECKEKKQKLSARWQLLDGVAEVDMFVFDELTVRKAMKHFPSAYFLIHDRPLGRFFLARVDEVACAERARLNRQTSPGKNKGKWVVDLRNFRQLTDPAAQLLPTILHDQTTMPWKRSECLTALPVREA